MNLHHENEQLNYFVLIDNSEVKESTIQKVNEWLEILGDSLKQIATKELKAIQYITNDYKQKLNNEVGAKEMLQALLNNISDIKN
jgi:dsRNA-specific ribonuclease